LRLVRTATGGPEHEITIEQLASIYAEVWPIVRSAYADACRERGKPIPKAMPGWHTTKLVPGFMSDRRWTGLYPDGVWRLAVGCPILLLAEEIHSGMRAYLGRDVYQDQDHDLYAVAGRWVSDWIRDRYPS